MKKVVIISLGRKTANSLKEQLQSILGVKAEVISYCTEDDYTKDLDCDLIIFSGSSVKDLVLNKHNIKSKYIVARRVIKHQSIYGLINLPKDLNVLLVNDEEDTCKVAINQLKNHGINHINYHPYFPKIDNYDKLDIAITPGESQFAPNCVKEVIDIGCREMDVTSIVEVLINLDYIDEFGDSLFAYYFRDMVSISKRYINIAKGSNKLKNILQDIVDNSQEGIIYTNTIDCVLVLNKKAQDILKIKKEDAISKNIYEVCSDLDNDIATINDKEVVITRKPIYSDNNIVGYVIALDTAENIEKMDDELRRKKKEKKVQAKYTFEDMIGSSFKTLKSIKLAKKIAKTNSTVLIEGESGTGKEILAQAIHNESDRANYPFVAINFAALSENLLESELFGYEDGAFTGAKKGGKVGLFKRAHKGTIFLDEIGDAPYHFQSRLLRVLQEREVTPVGGTESIPIDVRVIAATNKNLLEEVEKNNFREDLFYRLNVMPISTIPLRDRIDDIETLIKFYLKKNKVFVNLNDFMDNEALKFLKEYNWKGNIRELINVVEYLINIKDEDLLTIEDLPSYMMKNMNVAKNNSLSYKEIDDNIIWILEKINKYENIGRRSLAIMAKEENLDLGEGKIRTILMKMQEISLIKVNKGIKGTEILPDGRKIIENK